jgi:uncharacterized protein (TIGR00730 family)
MADATPTPRNVCVYAASSPRSSEAHLDAARGLARALVGAGFGIVYGGGGSGLMGAVADAALAAGGAVTGVLPRFMDDIEWGHRGLTRLELVDTMHARKERMLQLSEAVVSLPGGCGTLEELLEAITWKRLALWGGPIVLLNTDGFYDPLLAQLDRCIEERFLRTEHRAIWSVASRAEDVPGILASTPPWPRDARTFARVV